MTDFETVIGLEVHAQLFTRTKLFCACSIAFGAAPNTQVCPVCLGLPGTLPVMNERAAAFAVRAALALDCRIMARSIFARKNYFYPDLPKGYQVSQYERPFCVDGHLDVSTDAGERRIGITRIHLEEDAGKNLHGVGGESLVDLNRAGTPLIEIVSEPDLRASGEAAAYLRALRDVLVYLGINDGNLEQGSFRCDANVSVRPRGSGSLGTRTELKNLNSFRFVQKAIDVEVARQIAIIDTGGAVQQETRAYDPDRNETRTLRSKEDAHDYRYFPEPDLPPFVLDEAFVEDQRSLLPELPAAARARYRSEFGLTPQDAATLTAHPAYARFFDDVVRRLSGGAALAKKASNWIQTEVLRGAETHGIECRMPVSAEQVAELVELVESGRISGKQGKEVYAAIEGGARRPKDVVEQRGLAVVAAAEEIEPLCREVLERSASQVAAYRSGKKGILGFFVGQVMKASGGSADPKAVSDTLTRLLGG